MSKRLYTYLSQRGNRHNRWFPPGAQPTHIRVGRGVAVLQQICDTRRSGQTWPLYSDAVGVHPDQVGEAWGHSRSQGVPTEFTADGRAIFTSARHRKQYCEAYGYFDRNGGYGDPQRKR